MRVAPLAVPERVRSDKRIGPKALVGTVADPPHSRWNTTHQQSVVLL